MNCLDKSFFIACLVAVSVAAPTFAQNLFWITTSVAFVQEEDGYGIFDNREQYYQFMGDVKTEGANNPELMAMVPLLNDIVLNQPIGTTGKQYNATNSTLGLLSNDAVRKELEMVDDQFEDLKQANEEIQRRAVEQLRELDLSDINSATEQILAIRDQSEKELQETLLPHQMKRLRQLAAQNELRRRSLVDILTSEPMKSEFEISDKQSVRLRKSEKEIEAELERQIVELRKKAKEKLLNNLKSNQREQVEDWLGDSFEFNNELKDGKRRADRWKK